MVASATHGATRVHCLRVCEWASSSLLARGLNPEGSLDLGGASLASLWLANCSSCFCRASSAAVWCGWVEREGGERGREEREREREREDERQRGRCAGSARWFGHRQVCNLPLCPSACPSVCLSVRPSVCLPACLPGSLSLSLSLSLSRARARARARSLSPSLPACDFLLS